MAEGKRKRVLVFGDAIVDEYVYVTSERDSPEGAGPVLDVLRRERRLGGAANVAANVVEISRKLGAGCDVEAELVCVASQRTLQAASEAGIIVGRCYPVDDVVKTRIVRDGGYVARVDWGRSHGDPWAVAVAQRMFEEAIVAEAAAEADVVVVSDYCMDTVTDASARAAIAGCTRAIVDTKRRDLCMYSGARTLKLNEVEFAAQAGGLPGKYLCPEELFGHVIVTRGGRGAELRVFERLGAAKYAVRSQEFPVDRVAPVDVTGCGDTFVAAMAFELAAWSDDVVAAVKFANMCASRVVTKFGTSTV